ncbi:hypothetical protein FA95DRAFT_1682445 [Auriscalpium vulgare]|uniref:Uncharacterized protein n=1 Tax=Auriscalpium vulgare TaxID=40419 RepID=A0ACB8RFB7_9AGAM|nr:hypothetical protein FA95DRAFT_1682445 [Auriscalpium vulgare]
MSSSYSPSSSQQSAFSKMFSKKQNQPSYAQANDSHATLVGNAPSKSSTAASTPRDYEAAFGNLSSSYGFGAPLPSPASSSLPSRKHSRKSTSLPAPPPPTPSPSYTPPHRDYQAAFGDLSAAYGYGGSAPILPSMKTGKKSSPPAPKPVRQSNTDKVFGEMAAKYGMGGATPMGVRL